MLKALDELREKGVNIREWGAVRSQIVLRPRSVRVEDTKLCRLALDMADAAQGEGTAAT